MSVSVQDGKLIIAHGSRRVAPSAEEIYSAVFESATAIQGICAYPNAKGKAYVIPEGVVATGYRPFTYSDIEAVVFPQSFLRFGSAYDFTYTPIKALVFKGRPPTWVAGFPGQMKAPTTVFFFDPRNGWAGIDYIFGLPVSRYDEPALSNVSVRSAMTGGQTLTVGAVVGGGAKQVMIRAVGPTLNQFWLPGMPDPNIAIYDTAGRVIGKNDDWPAALSNLWDPLGAFSLPLGSRDAALLQQVESGFTVQTSGAIGGTVLVELYDVSRGKSRLVNLSARNKVGTGSEVLIAGFAVSLNGVKRLLVRAVGPSLSKFGVAPLEDPVLSIFDSKGTLIASNDDWDLSLASIFSEIGAFALDAGSHDSAVIVTVPAGGTYTAQISGGSGKLGEALIEIYELPL